MKIPRYNFCSYEEPEFSFETIPTGHMCYWDVESLLIEILKELKNPESSQTSRLKLTEKIDLLS
jgi:hypothetical protein